jgi:hypothetical protein
MKRYTGLLKRYYKRWYMLQRGLAVCETRATAVRI